MCHSGDVSKQDDGCATRIGPSFPFRVKLRKTHCEHMFSASPSNSDIAHYGRHFAFRAREAGLCSYEYRRILSPLYGDVQHGS